MSFREKPVFTLRMAENHSANARSKTDFPLNQSQKVRARRDTELLHNLITDIIFKQTLFISFTWEIVWWIEYILIRNLVFCNRTNKDIEM